MRLINWNIDSLNAALKAQSPRGKQSHQILEQIADQHYDVIGLQEVKLPPAGPSDSQIRQVRKIFGDGYQIVSRTAQPPARRSYGGEMFLYRSKLQPKVAFPTLDVPAPLNQQGRALMLEFRGFYLCQLYCPNSGPHLQRQALHHQWDQQLIKWVTKLREQKPVILVGDLAIAYSPLDVNHAKDHVNDPGFTALERQDMKQLLQVGFVDAFRLCHQTARGCYTWWPQIIPTSKKYNLGWRADYWLVDRRMSQRVVDSEIMSTGKRRDHAPITLELN